MNKSVRIQKEKSLRRSQDCAVCRLVRFYLLVAAPLVIMLGMGAIGSSEQKHGVMWIARVELIDFLALGAVSLLFVVVGFKAYKEYWKPRRQTRAINQILQNFSEKESDK